jgi:hypothetical protein
MATKNMVFRYEQAKVLFEELTDGGPELEEYLHPVDAISKSEEEDEVWWLTGPGCSLATAG